MNHGRHQYESCGCRCDTCRAANAAHSTSQRERRREAVRQRIATAEPGQVERGVKADLLSRSMAVPMSTQKSSYGVYRAIVLTLARELDHGDESKAAVCKVLRRMLAAF